MINTTNLARPDLPKKIKKNATQVAEEVFIGSTLCQKESPNHGSVAIVHRNYTSPNSMQPFGKGWVKEDTLYLGTL